MEGQNCRIGKVWTRMQLDIHVRNKISFENEKRGIQKIMNEYEKKLRWNN